MSKCTLVEAAIAKQDHEKSIQEWRGAGEHPVVVACGDDNGASAGTGATGGNAGAAGNAGSAGIVVTAGAGGTAGTNGNGAGGNAGGGTSGAGTAGSGGGGARTDGGAGTAAGGASSAFRSRGIYKSGNNQSSSYDDSVAGWGASAEKSWTDVNSRAWVAGEFIWTGIDYIGEPTPYEWPSKSSYFGAIDTANFPKDIFYFYQSRWNYGGPSMVHIVPMDWTSWTAGQSVRVFAYSNADSVELFLNGKSLGSKNVDPVAGHPNAGHLEWSVPFATGTLEAKATKGGSVAASDKVQTAGSAASLALSADRPSIRADGRDLAFVEVDVVDAQGVLVPRANNKVDFAIDGPGTLVGVDNGDATDHGSYKDHSRSAFSGKALAIIQSTTSPGTITVKATSGSLKASSVAITTGQ